MVYGTVARGIAALAVALALLGACGASAPGEAGGGQKQPAASAAPPPQLPDATAGEDLYQLPESVPPGEPGRVLRVQPLDTPEGVLGWRVLYHSTSLAGAGIVVSGLVFAPEGETADSRPVVTWGHGSVGIGDACAPSRYPEGIVRQPVFRELLARGFVVAATDYEGLGMPGVHPWLVGRSEGRGMLDAARAAAEIPGTRAGNRVVAFGASQGGGAALFAGELAEDYAGDLELLGVAAAAPAAELDLLALLPQQNVPGIAGFLVMGALGFAAAYPELPLDAVLQPEVLAQRSQLEALCQDQFDRRFRTIPLERILKTSPANVEPWAEAISANTPGRTMTGAPVLLVHGNRDRVVPAQVSDLLFERLCRIGVRAEKQIYGGVDHGGILGASQEDVLGWIEDRVAGRPPEDRDGVQRCS